MFYIDHLVSVNIFVFNTPKISILGDICKFYFRYLGIINDGFISKDIGGGFEKIEKLYSNSHFFFVPSKSECLGIAFCEAMSYGLPCVSSIAGGIPTIIKDNYNGILLPIEATAEEYAKRILQVFNSKSIYKEMSKIAYNEYVTKLNWKVAGETMVKYLKTL
ncbi:MAG: glycosyltransferase family 4 protein [Prevotellaceae bacterium]|nr:glycosyltransferase family 4 protein [Prevotellaceae bacterium]